MHQSTSTGSTNKKGPATSLEVRIGTKVFVGPNAAKAFCRAIEAIGFERIAHLDLTVSGLPLISLKRPGKKRTAARMGDWYVVTHSSTRDKKAVLEQAAEMLAIPIRVRIVAKDEARDLELDEMLALNC